MLLRYYFIIFLALIIPELNISMAEDDKSLKSRFLNKVQSENLIEDNTRFNNVSKPLNLMNPFNSKSAPNLKQTDSINMMFRFMLLIPIRFHQKVITHQDGLLCTFQPTCSQYGYEAIKRYGLRGLLMASDRFLRCYRGNRKYYPTVGPFAYDPVP